MVGRAVTAALAVETIKLNRSLALALALIAPGLIGVYTLLNALRVGEPREWDLWLAGNAFIWASFMLPMSLTALSALMAQMEHSPQSWDQLRALPVPRWTIYAAKATLLIALMFLMSMAVPMGIAAALVVAGWIDPQAIATGRIDGAATAARYARVSLAGLLIAALQFWIAVRFTSFVPAMALGIGGTFFALVAHSAENGVFFPWIMPVHTLSTDPAHAGLAMSLGGGLGGAVMLAAVVHLASREQR